MQNFDHLFVNRWPFTNVPDDESSRLWADRSTLRAQIDRLIWRWSRYDQSTIHLMWADLGAGKSHTLRYIQARVGDDATSSMYPVYSVLPRELRNFVNVYQAILSSIDLESLAEQTIAIVRQMGKESLIKAAFTELPEAVTALIALLSQNESQRRTAAEWIRGTRGLTKRDLREIGVLRSIRSTDDAVAALSGIMYVMRAAKKTSRFIVMLDEAQRLGQASNKVRHDVNVGLQTWYDSSPHNLTLILSFGSGDEAYVRHMVSPELQRREDHERLRLDLLRTDEIVDFVGDLLDQSRSKTPPDRWFPFTKSLVHNLSHNLGENGGSTPGTVMKAFNAVLTELDYLIATGDQHRSKESLLLEKGLEAVRMS